MLMVTVVQTVAPLNYIVLSMAVIYILAPAALHATASELHLGQSEIVLCTESPASLLGELHIGTRRVLA
jgi:hypothetical protein